jgi:hypothetical protein
MKRVAKKIDAVNFVALMCIESQKGSPSYNDLVARFDAVHNISASKQALWLRVNQACVMFFQAILAQIIKHQVLEIHSDQIKGCLNYNRIILQDSTIIKLPQRLFGIFSGVSNGHKAVCNVRLQGVYDLISGQFLYFSIDPYSKNDLLAAPELKILKRDLTLRDRGYYTNNEIERHVQAGAFCIYRYKYKTIFLDPVEKKPVDLLTLLKKKGNVDIQVCLNNKEQTQVRLVACKVSDEIANTRKMKAKKENKGHNPSFEYLELLGWTIFITNIDSNEADFDKLLSIYRLRWRIEIIFKIWKSHMSFEKIHQVSYNQLHVMLTARFIMIIISTHKLYNFYDICLYQKFKMNLSMMKFIKYLMKNTQMISKLLIAQDRKWNSDIEEICEKLKRYCTYEKRKRQNHCHLFEIAFLT